MKYYTIFLSADPTIIGVNNGLYQAKYDKDCFASTELYEKFYNFFYDLNYYQKLEKFSHVNIDIKKIHLLNKAKVTDVMGVFPSIPHVRFLISEKLKNIFIQFQLQKNLIFETILINKKNGTNYLYYFFYLPILSSETIILEKSELYTRKVYYDRSQFKTEDTIHKIKSKEHYQELNYSLLSPRFSKICISSVYKNYDLIDIDEYIFISETLKEKIEKEKITGLNIGDRCELIFD